MGITECHDAMPDDHRDHGVTAAATSMHAGDGRKDRSRGQLATGLTLQLVGKHIEQCLSVRARVEMTPILARQRILEFIGIGEIAVMRQADPIGRIDIERLGFRGAGAAGGRIAAVADPHVAPQAQHVAFLEHVANQTQRLAGVQGTAFFGADTRGILPAVLKDRQCVVNCLIDWPMGNDSYNSAHRIASPGRATGVDLSTQLAPERPESAAIPAVPPTT